MKTNARYQKFVLKETMKKQDRCPIQKVKKNSMGKVECYHQPGQLTPYQADAQTLHNCTVTFPFLFVFKISY